MSGKPGRALLWLLLVLGVMQGACVVQAGEQSVTNGPSTALKPYEKILADFDPSLRSVQLVPQQERGTITREGKGWLEVTPDGRRILHLKGTPREMGYQHGKLLAGEIHTLTNTILQTVGLVETVRTGEPFIDRLRKTQARAKPFIPAEYIEEARGIAEGAGLPPEAILLANIFPELFHCSGFALWGKATADGKLYHGRVLDYMNEIGLQDLAVVTVYEPVGKIPWVNISYAGFIGSVTGMNARQISIGEMGGRGEGAWDGMPMTYLMRHTLETAGTLEDALKSYRETPRTCEYYYVIADGKIPIARGLAATPARLDVVGPGEKHEKLPYPVPDTVLLSAGDRYGRLVMRTQANYGRFTAMEALALMRRPVAMKSCLHAALFCPADGRFWVANATHDKQPASEQPYAAYNLNELLQAKPDSAGALEIKVGNTTGH